MASIPSALIFFICVINSNIISNLYTPHGYYSNGLGHYVSKVQKYQRNIPLLKPSSADPFLPYPMSNPISYHYYSFDQYLFEFNDSPTFFRLKIDTPSKYAYRKSIFEKNLKMIETHNRNPNRTYNMKINEFVVLTQKQFQFLYTNLNIPPSDQAILAARRKPEQKKQKSMNWTVSYKCKGGFVENQGICGAGYAFATADTTAITFRIYNNYPVYNGLSAQDIVNSNGCKGGSFLGAFSKIVKDGILLKKSMYYQNAFSLYPINPFKLNRGTEKVPPKAFLNWARVKTGDCHDLLKTLQMRPVTVGLALSFEHAFYSDGIISAPFGKINSAAVLVAYHEDVGYVVKNHWGFDWGNEGYAWISKDQSMNGRICDYGMYIVTKNEIQDPISCVDSS